MGTDEKVERIKGLKFQAGVHQALGIAVAADAGEWLGERLRRLPLREATRALSMVLNLPP